MHPASLLAIALLLPGCIQFGAGGQDDRELSSLDGLLRAGRTQAEIDDLHRTVRAHSPSSDVVISNQQLRINELEHCDIVRMELDAKAYVVALGACLKAT